MKLNTEQLLAKWLSEYENSGNICVIQITRATPRFQTRNYFARFKVKTAKLDGTGLNPTDIKCFVLETSETSQTVYEDSSTSCDSIEDLENSLMRTPYKEEKEDLD